MSHKFNHMITLQHGNNKVSKHEVFCEFEIERDLSISMYIQCCDTGIYEPVCNKTDLYKEMLESAKVEFNIDDLLDEYSKDLVFGDKRIAKAV